MKDMVRLSSSDMEHLVVTMETSLTVTNRAQFYLWAQGALQGFLPHETLLCATGDIAQMRFKAEIFSRGVLDAKVEEDITDPVNGVLTRLVDDWLRGSRTPRMSCAEGEGQVGRRQLLADLNRREFGHFAAHGAREMQGDFGSFFVFVQLPEAPSARSAYLLELLMPYLHMALHRMRAHEGSDKAGDSSGVALLSKREIQVLHWVKNGKTNQEIGQILAISPPTVKNHVQNLMRKLNVNNRAQAVGKSATLRLIAPGEGS